jgi:hypothetical protein
VSALCAGCTHCLGTKGCTCRTVTIFTRSPRSTVMNEVKRCLAMPIRRRQHLRASAAMVVAILILALWGAGSTTMRADDDACTCTVNKTYNVDVCIDGTTYNLDASFCETNYPLNNLPMGDCLTGRGMNRKSTLRKICFTGTPPSGYTDAQIIGYLLCHIKTTACNTPASPYGFAVPAPPLSFYCWEIKVPKCTARDNGCIVPCSECLFCIHAYAWERTSGSCGLDISRRCNPAAQCIGTNCTENGDCPFETCCN